MPCATRDVKYFLWPDYVRAVAIPLATIEEFEAGKTFRSAREILELAVEGCSSHFDFGTPRIIIPRLVFLRKNARLSTHKFPPKIRNIFVPTSNPALSGKTCCQAGFPFV